MAHFFGLGVLLFKLEVALAQFHVLAHALTSRATWHFNGNSAPVDSLVRAEASDHFQKKLALFDVPTPVLSSLFLGIEVEQILKLSHEIWFEEWWTEIENGLWRFDEGD